MNVKHLAVGGLPATAIVGIVAVLTKNRVHLTTDEAVLYGGFALGAGTAIAHQAERFGRWLAHRIEAVGVCGIFSGLAWGKRGRPAKAAPATK